MLKRSALREILRSPGRFLALFAIMALGVGFFAGLRVTKTAMIATADDYLSRSNFFDYKLVSTLGYDDASVAAAAAADGVRGAEGAVTADALCGMDGGSDVVLRFHSLPQSVNTLTVTAGRLPAAADECAADSRTFTEADIGRTVVLSDQNAADTLENFAGASYTIVGLVQSPLYLNFERGTTSLGSGSVAGFVYLPRSGFAAETWTEIYLTLTEGGALYSDAYKTAADAAKGSVTAAAESAADARWERLKADAQDKLDSAEADYQDAVRTYDDGEAAYERNLAAYTDGVSAYEKGLASLADSRAEAETQFRSAKEKLLAAQAELDASAAQLAAARQELNAKQAELNAAYTDFYTRADAVNAQRTAAFAQLDDAQAQLSDAAALVEQQLNALPETGAEEQRAALEAQRQALEARQGDLDAQYDAAKALFAAYDAQLDDAKAQLDDAQTQLDGGYAGLAASEAQYEASASQLASGWDAYESSKEQTETQLAAAKTGLDETAAELESARTQLDTAAAELADGRASLADGKKQLDEGRAELAKLQKPDVYVLDRTSNTGYACFESDADIVKGVSNVFPLFFFLVAALICMTTMTRMVDDQRVQIGVLKALGYGDWAISRKYLFYVGSSSAAGCVGGFYLGSWLIPEILWNVYGIMYGFAPLRLVFDYRLGIVTSAAYLVSVLAVTWLSCRSELTGVPASLIRPKTPPAGKRILLERMPFVWKRFSFLRKVSARNIFRYRRRLLMMVLGVAGCTALLLTGFGVNDSISGVVDDQYSEIALYDLAVTGTKAFTEEEKAAVAAAAGSGAESIAYIHESSVKLTGAGGTGSAYLVVGSGDDLTPVISLHDADGAIAYPGGGCAVVTTGIASQLGIRTGDTVTVLYDGTQPIRVTVSGVCDNYIYNYVYLSPGTCEQALGFVPAYKTALVKAAGGADDHALSAALLGVDGVAGVSVTSDMRARVGSILSNLRYIVLLVIVCAGALAFTVIYNLTNISIAERIREIATIKVLGFFPWESAQYVFRENLVMTGMGALAGLGLGKLLHLYVMNQIRIDLVHFAVRISFMSCVWSVLLTFAFACVVDFFMYFRLQKIPMAESLKSVE